MNESQMEGAQDFVDEHSTDLRLRVEELEAENLELKQEIEKLNSIIDGLELEEI